MKNFRNFAFLLCMPMLTFITLSCAHTYGCVIEVKNIKHIKSDHYSFNSTVAGDQYQFDLYIKSRLCDDEETKRILNEIFQKHSKENGFNSFEVFNVYQTKVMDRLEYSVSFK